MKEEQMDNEHTTHAECKAGHNLFSLAQDAIGKQKFAASGGVFTL
jgi:hypothetical protein